MLKTYFHNSKSTYENKDKKKLAQINKKDSKVIVDINILLNRVKIEKKNQLKRKIIFFSFSTLALSTFGALISILK